MTLEAKLESIVPELNPFHPRVVNLGAGQTRAVITDRIRRLLEHPALARLGNIRQLGLITLVYPGATHSRLEHALGTYAQVAEYIRALYYNRTDPIFRSIFEPEHFKTVMLAALLHDVGYYPLAHDLEDCSHWRDSNIHHEEYSARIIAEHLSPLIRRDWDLDAALVIDLITPSSNDFRTNILRSIISGPIDADKMDYLLRDGMHLGLPYCNAIDKQMFLRNLTVVYGEGTPAGIAITDKGRVSADSIAFARYAMFTVAYWHHAVRSIKAMLRYAVSRRAAKYNREEHFSFFSNISEAGTPSLPHNPSVGVTDFQQLSWIHDKVDDVGKALLRSILIRELYKRIFVIDSSTRDTEPYHSKLRSGGADFVEEFRTRIDSAIWDKIPKSNVTKPDPLILVDVPRMDSSEPLYYTTEQKTNLLSESSIVWKDLAEGFSKSIGKVRIFAHPQFREIIAKTLNRDDLIELIGANLGTPAGRQ